MHAINPETERFQCQDPCPCGSGATVAECCGPYLAGEATPPTAEACMRSRYCAYVLDAPEHLRRTLTPRLRKDFDPKRVTAERDQVTWLGLDILDTEAGGPEDETGMVHFEVRYEAGGTPLSVKEKSRFVREDGRWLYSQGEIERPGTVVRETPKVGRNEPCPCGSGKKFKKCCGA